MPRGGGGHWRGGGGGYQQHDDRSGGGGRNQQHDKRGSSSNGSSYNNRGDRSSIRGGNRGGSGSRGRGRGRGRGGFSQQSREVMLELLNLPNTITMENIIEWIQSECVPNLEYKSFDFRPMSQKSMKKSARFCVKHMSIATKIQRELDNFAGLDPDDPVKINILNQDGGHASDSSSSKGDGDGNNIVNFIQNNFNAEEGCLVLDNLYQQRPGFNTDINKAYFPRELCSVIQHQNLSSVLTTLVLNNNRIYTLSHLQGLGNAAPNLRNLSFEGNILKDHRELDHLRGLKQKLERLIMKGNPMTQYAEYRSTMKRKFPNLKQLDGVDFPPDASFGFDDVVAQKAFLPPSKKLYTLYTLPVSAQDILGFLESYYKCFDELGGMQRQQLMDAYHADSEFSLSFPNQLNSSHSHSSSSHYHKKQYAIHNRNLSGLQRNLKNITHTKERVDCLKRTPLNIVHVITLFPKTLHDLSQVSVDIICLHSSSILVNLAGVYKEFNDYNNKSFTRAFHRTLVIYISNVNNRISYQIANDMMNLTPDNYRPNTNNNPSGSGSTPVVDPLANLPPLNPQQKEILSSLVVASKLTHKFAFECLVASNWDLNAAMNLFNQKRSQLAPDAFQS